MKHISIFKLENLSLLTVSKLPKGIILDLERCMEVVGGKLGLFTLYNIFANLFLKPVVMLSSFRMWTPKALQVSLEGMRPAGVSYFYHLLIYLYSLFEDSLNQIG